MVDLQSQFLSVAFCRAAFCRVRHTKERGSSVDTNRLVSALTPCTHKGKVNMATRRNSRPVRNIDPNLKENPAFQKKMEALYSSIVPEGFKKLDISFPPYWKADLATGFRAIVLRREDPKLELKEDGRLGQKEGPGQFSRYLWRNTGPALDCRRGAVADGEIETVEPGRIFSTSAFGGLNLDKYLGFELAVLCVDLRQLPANAESGWAPREMWVFDTYVGEETDRLLASRDESDMKRLAAAQHDADLLGMEEMMRLNAKAKYQAVAHVGIPVPGYGTPVNAGPAVAGDRA